MAMGQNMQTREIVHQTVRMSVRPKFVTFQSCGRLVARNTCVVHRAVRYAP